MHQRDAVWGTSSFQPSTVRLQSPLPLHMREKQRTFVVYLLESLGLASPVGQSVNGPGSGSHREGGDSHRMMNEVRLISHSQCSAQRRPKLYCDPWIWKWDCKAASDSLSPGSWWQRHTCHDEPDVACRDMFHDIMPLVPHQHFAFFSATPQDVPQPCGCARFSPTTFQSILIILWPGIQFVPATLCCNLWAELIWRGKSSARREINYCSLSKAHNRAHRIRCTRLSCRY